ncbi:MAG: hypothetical protein KF760_21125 [Candidatus Eremiobacteraeota bacterium]|nr:hypothetical protein [Candidatus Eremiobacteraeota bacterium]MCW5867301.1 hypothetical protein [Candidatus Eremiobacteraeota bacterium]
MKLQRHSPQTPRPLPPPKPPEPNDPGSLVDHVGAVQLGGLLSDLGMGAAYTFGASTPVSGLGLAMAAFHGARGAAFGALALKEKEAFKLKARIGVAASEGLLAAGHALGALGGGAWSIPLLAAGAGLNAFTDYKYRTHFGVEAPAKGPVSPARIAGAMVDGALGVSYAAGASSLGLVAGAGHLGAMVGYYGGSLWKPEMKHHWHSKGFGHALLAAGHLAGAAGAGAWVLPVLAGGTLITTLQDSRQNAK